MLAIQQQTDGTFYPVILCDACGIEIVRQGNYEWSSTHNSPIYFSHTGCSSHLLQIYPQINTWTPLKMLPIILMEQLKVTDKDKERISMFMDITHDMRHLAGMGLV